MPTKELAPVPRPLLFDVWGYFRRQLRRPAVAMFLIGLLLVLLNVILIDRIRPYNSDDVAWQTTLLTWRPDNAHTAVFGSDPFIVKLPFFMLLGALVAPARGWLLATNLLFAALNFLFFYAALLYFYRLFKIRISYYTLLPAIWLAALGHLFSSLFLNPNLRSFELGLSLVLFVLAAKIFYGELRPLQSKRSKLLTGLGCVLVAVLIVNDLYFFYFGVLPLAVFMLVLGICMPERRRQAGLILGRLLAGSIAAKLLHKLVATSGIYMIKSAGDHLVGPARLPSKAYSTIRSLQLVFNADFWHHRLWSLFTLGLIINALTVVVVLGYTAVKLVPAVRRRHFTTAQTWQLFFLALFGFVLAIYTITTVSAGVDTYRYLVILPFLLVPLIALGISRAPHRWRPLIAGCIIASILLNFFITIRYNQVALAAWRDPNEVNHALINELTRRGLTRGYGNYWDANINTYLSGGKIHILPFSCTPKGTIDRFIWLADANLFTPVANQKTFLMTDPSRVDPQLCSEQRITAQFGPPAETFIIQNHTIRVYNDDIVAKFH